MTHEQYVKKVKELEYELRNVTSQYILTNQIYKPGDILEISFKYFGKDIKRTCKIINVYPAPTYEFGTHFGNWPKGKLEYFARYYFRNNNGELIEGEVCPLGDYSNSISLCGYHLSGIDPKLVKIKVINESKL